MERLLENKWDAILHFTTTKSPVFNTGAVTYSMVVPGDWPVEHLDLGACLENTLHRMVETGMSDAEIERELGAVRRDAWDEDDTYIDLGYVIPGSIMNVYKD